MGVDRTYRKSNQISRQQDAIGGKTSGHMAQTPYSQNHILQLQRSIGNRAVMSEAAFKEFDESSRLSFIYETKRMFDELKRKHFWKEAAEIIRQTTKLNEEEWFEDMEYLDYEEQIDRKVDELALARPEPLREQEEYNQRIRQLVSLDAELFPTDCGILANYVSGQKNGEKKAASDDPAAGQSYYIEPEVNEEVNTSESEKNLWGSHHAAIIMADGADHVTFEGAKQTTKDNINKVNFDTSWYFAMYGNEEGQTFHDAYKVFFEEGAKTNKTEKR